MRTMRAIGLALAGTALVMVVSACGSTSDASLSTTPGPGATSSLVAPESGMPSPSDAAAPAASLTSPVQGIVLHVDSPSLGKVSGFRMLLADGRQVDFVVGTLENAADFPAAHLPEHVATSEPVLVYFRAEGPNLVVYRLEDAASASPSAS